MVTLSASLADHAMAFAFALDPVRILRSSLRTLPLLLLRDETCILCREEILVSDLTRVARRLVNPRHVVGEVRLDHVEDVARSHWVRANKRQDDVSTS